VRELNDLVFFIFFVEEVEAEQVHDTIQRQGPPIRGGVSEQREVSYLYYNKQGEMLNSLLVRVRKERGNSTREERPRLK